MQGRDSIRMRQTQHGISETRKYIHDSLETFTETPEYFSGYNLLLV
jgi:hypothetical protein